ncbi:MAG: dihydroxy-acid dehydratase [Clostridiales bacterium]|nr:dihydroxy-acid dehydratase [Clostridiales bacterium]
MLKSQNVRKAGPEVDPLWIGAGRTVKDLSKPQILIDSTAGDSHPGSKHLMGVAETVKNSVYSSQGMPSIYTVTDICDGVATGHAGMNYSLISREIIAGMVEIHARAAGFDGLVTISSCDKATPGHLMALARLDIPAIHICGGSMAPGPSFISADNCYETNLRVAEGKMMAEEEWYYKRNACPSCGACQYMGTASTMQCISEALGISLPGNAVAPANGNILMQIASEAGERVVQLVNEDIRPSKILTRSAFENAIKVHAAIGGSTNAVLHLPAVAKELGIEITLDDFEKLTEGIPLLTSLLTAGKWPTQFFWYAGGIPRVMLELKDMLDLNALTVTGRTVGENLEYLEKTGYFRRSEKYLGNFGMKSSDIIKPFDEPEDADSGVTILKGNIAVKGAVIKHCAMDKSMYHFEGRARVFDNEESAEEAIYSSDIKAGEVVVVRYVGKKAAGMPEMLKATDAICNKEELNNSCALITDGRFSGATRGPSVGYLLPEAAEGGAIAYIDDNDIVEIDIYKKSVNIVGINGRKCTPAEVDAEFEKRRSTRQHKTFTHKGVLRFLDV